MVPHPVSTLYCFTGNDRMKSEKVVAVGRWDDERQKRPRLLADTIERVLRERAGAEFEIYGSPGHYLPLWHNRLAPQERARVRLAGIQSPDTLAGALRGAMVFLSSSAYEGGQIAAMEALCSGCGFVGCSGPMLACNQWFAGEGFGTLATKATMLADALLEELKAWDEGRRSPGEIARRWGERVHAPNVARLILQLAGEWKDHGHA
jgi:glycosyltransferase involved in cell wall biosynthesis